MNDCCVKCNKRKIRYIAPGKWCTFCWADWWFDPKEGAGTQLEKFFFLLRKIPKDILEDLIELLKK